MEVCLEKQFIKNQVALFNLLGALIEKLTGQRPNVFVQQEDGSLVKIAPTMPFVTWAEVEPDSFYRSPKETSIEKLPDGEPDAERLTSQQFP